VELTLSGFDVYGAEVDDKGINFVIRKAVDNFYDVQVKTARLPGGNYVYLAKDGFELRRSMIAALVLLSEREPPEGFLIPALAWQKPDSLLCDMNYEGMKSKPEFGIRLSARNLPMLHRFTFEQQAALL